MTLVWDNFPGAGSELLTMLALADWCNDAGGSLHPSVSTVAKKIRASESQARRIMHGLIADGWLAVIGNAGGGAPGTTRQYRLNVERLAQTGRVDATPTGSADATPRMDATPSTHARDGSHGCAETGRTHDTLTVSRSTKEPPKDITGDELAFERIWQHYPPRAGGSSKPDARKAYLARRKQGHTHVEILEGVQRYAAYIVGTGRERTEYVKQAATFLGPGLHFQLPWDLPVATIDTNAGDSKTLTGLKLLQEMRNGLAETGSSGRVHDAGRALAGPDTSDGYLAADG